MSSLLRLECSDLYEDNDPEKTGYEDCKSVFNTNVETVWNLDISQNIKNLKSKVLNTILMRKI